MHYANERVSKTNLDKSKAIMLGGEEGLVCEVSVEESQLNHDLKFEYLD